MFSQTYHNSLFLQNRCLDSKATRPHSEKLHLHSNVISTPATLSCQRATVRKGKKLHIIDGAWVSRLIFITESSYNTHHKGLGLKSSTKLWQRINNLNTQTAVQSFTAQSRSCTAETTLSTYLGEGKENLDSLMNQRGQSNLNRKQNCLFILI